MHLLHCEGQPMLWGQPRAAHQKVQLNPSKDNDHEEDLICTDSDRDCGHHALGSRLGRNHRMRPGRTECQRQGYQLRRLKSGELGYGGVCLCSVAQGRGGKRELPPRSGE